MGALHLAKGVWERRWAERVVRQRAQLPCGKDQCRPAGSPG